MINLLRLAGGFDLSGGFGAAIAGAPATADRTTPATQREPHVADAATGRTDTARAADAAATAARAFEALVDTHYRRIYSLMYRMVRNESDAADLTQETFVRVYRALPSLRETGAQSAWVRRIATNLCLDFLRRRTAVPIMSSLDARATDESDTLQSWDIADPGGEPDRVHAARERLAVLHRAIESLPEDYRQVIVLHHLEEMRVEEIAEAQGVPAGTIKSRLSRARRELHRKLSPYFDPNMALPGR